MSQRPGPAVMLKAICARCGERKSAHHSRCGSCAFLPHADEERAESIYFSIDRFSDADDRRRYSRELKEWSRKLKAGQNPKIDRREIERLLEQKKQLERVPPAAVWGAVVRLFLPAVAFLLLLLLILWFLEKGPS